MKKVLLMVLMILVLPVAAFAGDTGVIGVAQSEAGAIAISGTGSQYPIPQPIYPYLLQLIPGVIGDATKDMPQFDAVLALTTEKAVKVTTFNGWCWDRIRLEDVEEEVLKNLPAAMKRLGVDTAERIRFKVRYKMSSRTIGSGGGGGGSVAGFGGGANPVAYGSNASVMPGMAVNTADPQFIISYYLVSLTPVKVGATETEWKKVETTTPGKVSKASESKPGSHKALVFGKEVEIAD